MTRIIASALQKGGVGKTTFVQNVGYELSLLGQRVLMVDIDPQANLTMGWGFDLSEPRPTVYQAMLNPADTAQCVVNIRPNLDLLPASLDLAGAERQFMMDIYNPTSKLKKALAPIARSYDFVLVDPPPTLGFFMANTLSVVTEIIIPLQVHAYAYKALDQFLPVMIEAKEEVNSELYLSGIVLTLHDRRKNLSRSVAEAVRERFGELVFETVVPDNVRIAEAPLEGQAVAEYDPRCKGAGAFRALAKEVLERG